MVDRAALTAVKKLLKLRQDDCGGGVDEHRIMAAMEFSQAISVLAAVNRRGILYVLVESVPTRRSQF